LKWTRTTEFCKDPADVIDFTMDFKQLLQADTISTATVTATSVDIDSSAVSGNVVTIWASGGNEGATGIVKVTVVTANATPRTFERSFRIKIKQL